MKSQGLMVGSATSCRPTSGLTGEERTLRACMHAQGWQECGLACRWSLGSPSGHVPGCSSGRKLGFYWLSPVSHPDPCARKHLLRNRCFFPSFICSSSHPSIHPSSTHFFMCPSIRGSVHPLIHLSTHSFIHPSFVRCSDCYEADIEPVGTAGLGVTSVCRKDVIST